MEKLLDEVMIGGVQLQIVCVHKYKCGIYKKLKDNGATKLNALAILNTHICLNNR